MAGVPVKRKRGRPPKDSNAVSASKLINSDDGSSKYSISESCENDSSDFNDTQCYCNSCKKWVSEGIFCEGKCESWYHYNLQLCWSQ